MNTKKRYNTLFCAFLSLFLSHNLFSGPKTRQEMIAAHRHNLEEKLQPLERADRDTILRNFDQAMPSYSNDNLIDNDFISQVSGTIITGYAKTKAELQARKLSSDRQKVQQFAEEQESIVFTKLCNNEPLGGIFDEKLTAAVQSRFGNQEKPVQQQPPYWNIPRPAQPVPSAPVVHSHSSTDNNNYPYQKGPQPFYYASSDNDKKRIAEGKKELDQISTMLYNKKLTNRTITRFGIFFLKSIQENNRTSVIPPLVHTQNAFVALFDYELEQTKIKLSREIPSSILDKAITTTKETLLPQIRQFTPQTAEKFQCALSTLEDTIIENAGIACPICTESYKQEDAFGSVDKVILQSPFSGYPCHSICKTCAKNGSLNNCPQCRGAIDKQDLRQKVSQPDNPANWRP